MMMYDDENDEDWFNSEDFLNKEHVRCLINCIHERSVVIKNLIDVVATEETKVFWPVFLDVWPCGPTWTHRNKILEMLRHHAAQEPARNYMDTLAGSFFDDL